jgi:hypothetical protein
MAAAAQRSSSDESDYSGGNDLVRRLRRAHEGEIFGESLFKALAGTRTDRNQVQALTRLSVLERAMGRCLATLLDRFDVGSADASTSAAATRGRETAAALEAEPWRALLEVFRKGTRHALEGYRRLRAVAPDPNDPILVALVDHEEALRAFGERSLRGDAAAMDPVEAVIRQLGMLQQGATRLK